MLSTDREEFEVQLSLLCQGYGVWVGDRADAYFKGLAKMSLIEFARCVEFALSEAGPERLPNVHGIWKIRRELRTSFHPAKPPEALPEQGKWLLLVNGLFLKYLLQRRITEQFKGELHIEARRRECLKLAEFFEAIEAQADPEATERELQIRFARIMARSFIAEDVCAMS